MKRSRVGVVLGTVFALAFATMPAGLADTDDVGLVDLSQGQWHLRNGFSATLSGAAEVPGPGDADGGGTGHFSFDSAAGEVCFSIDVHSIDGLIAAAHIHSGTAIEAGPIVIDLEWPTTVGVGCVTGIDSATISSVESSPSNFYLNVHSTVFPAGAVRGQLTTGGSTSFYFGNPSDIPFLGDWNGDGVDTPGLYRRSDGFVYLRNSNTAGPADISYFFGNPDDVPLAGDFNGNGFDTVSLYRPSEQRFYISNKLGPNGGSLGPADFSFIYGNPGDIPFAGDFDGDGTDTIGVRRPLTGEILQRNSNSAGPADTTLIYGNPAPVPTPGGGPAPGDRFRTGDWDGNTTDTPGVFRSSDARFYLRNSNTTGIADETFFFGEGGWVPVAGSRTPAPPVEIQFLNISDWHAQLDPLFVFGEGTFGGAAELKAYWDVDRAANPNTITLTAGDAFGASPPLSSFFDEEPAVRSMNLMGFDVDGLGNHNFDAGIAGLQNLIDIAEFQYLSANLKNVDDNLTGVKPWVILRRGGINVGIVGVTNPEAPTLVFPSNFGTIEVTDPVAAAMAAKAEAEAAGAQVMVALGHIGVTDVDGGGVASGPLIDFANGVSGFDLIFGDHTNFEFEGTINGALVVENRSKGRTYAKVELVVDGNNGDVISATNTFVDPVSADVTPDPGIVAFLDPLRATLDALLSTVIGQSTVAIPRSDECGQSAGRTCESLIGNVVTDAMRDRYGTDFAITNSGGLRADLTCPDPDIAGDFCPAPDGGDLEITDGTVLTVLPFGNSVVTLSVTGAELKEHLERGVSAMPGVSGRFAQVSGLCFTYDIALAVGSRVTGAVRQAVDGSCTGPAVDLTASSTHTLAENDFMASGGDGYPVDIGSAVTRELLDQVTAAYITGNTPISPAIQGRITCTDSVAPDDCPVPIP